MNIQAAKAIVLYLLSDRRERYLLISPYIFIYFPSIIGLSHT